MSVEDPFETFESHCPHDLGSPLNEKGQTKITKCLSTGLQTLHAIMEGRSSDVKVVTESFFNFIGCAADKPKQQSPRDRGKNQKTSPPIPRSAFIDGAHSHGVIVSKDTAYPPLSVPNYAKKNNLEHRNQARSSRSFVGANAGRGGAKNQDSYKKGSYADNNHQSSKQPKNPKCQNKTLDAIQQVAAHANEDRRRHHPNSHYRGDRGHKVNGVNSENRHTSNSQHYSNLVKNEQGRQDVRDSSNKGPTHNNPKHQQVQKQQ
jgi:hypothetical protein